MTPVDQQEPLDCFRCCIATILDLPYHEVPNFYKGMTPGQTVSDGKRMFIQTWFASRGLYLIGFPVEAISVDQMLEVMKVAHPGVHYLMQGQNRHGRDHIVVCKDNEIVHDPSEGKTGLTYPTLDENFHIFLIGKLL